MITDNGKDIIAKYLIGQIPAFATHIAVGCGSRPLKNTDTLDVFDSQTKYVLDFEMARSQIISQGFVDQNYDYEITQKTKKDNVATLTIGDHVLSVGDTVNVDLDTPDPEFDGPFRISDVSSTTVSYYTDTSITGTPYNVSNKQLSNNIATLTTSANHNFIVGDIVLVSSVDSTFNGEQIVLSITNNTFTFFKEASNVISTPVSPVGSAKIIGLSDPTVGKLSGTKTKISLTAALPSENRYEITEVGLWSAGNNILATGTDSRLLCSFSESWQGHSTSVFSPTFKESIGTTTGIDQQKSQAPEKIFYVSTGNTVLHTGDRRERKEGPRFLNRTIMVRGDTCDMLGGYLDKNTKGTWNPIDVTNDIVFKQLTNNVATITTNIVSPINEGDIINVVGVDATFNGTYTVLSVEPATKTINYTKQASNVNLTSVTGATVSTAPTHIHLNNFNFNIGENSPSDELALALSVIDKDSLGNGTPDGIKILMEFYRNEIAVTQTGVAKKEIYIDFDELNVSSYQVVRFKISDLITDENFNASDISVCRIFTCVIKDGEPSPNHYVSYDGFRIDNVTTENPVYKLSGYSVVQNVNGYPIIKLPNSNNYIEFRLSLGLT